MKRVTICLTGLLLLTGLALLASCAPQALPTQTAPTEAPAAVEATTPSPTRAPTPTAFIEERLVELEWPSHLRLGESDVLRLSLIPVKEGYVARAEFEEHPLETQEAPIRHAPGYTLQGIARLDGIGFDISPAGEQRRVLSPGEPAAWRWTLSAHEPGQHRLSVSLTLRWEPEEGVTGPVSESLAYGRGLDVQVDSILGMTQSQAVMASLFGLLFGAGIGGFALVSGRRIPHAVTRLRKASPNRALAIELGSGIQLASEEVRIAQALFNRYQRVLINGEFKSGYSGARAFLVRPVSANGMADAETIAKLGPRVAIQAEFENYERYVKDRLPPVTARIQQPPVAVAGGKLAGLQYTFIAEPGHTPRSLRQALLDKPDPLYLQRLFQTIGPNWWMQRQAYTFRLEAEYDRYLPPHGVLEPVLSGRAQAVLEPGSNLPLKTGDILRLGRFQRLEPRLDGKSWSLVGEAAPGKPAQRLRWLSAKPPESGALAKVVASRVDLLRGWTASFERFGLPDPLQHLERWLATTIQGTRSTIHGDLNLENILIGPGELVWLIDFAQTREGHPMFDFAHLGGEIVAHILAERCGSGEAYLERLAAGDELLQTVQEIASRCMFDPQQVDEYRLPLILACLGALKFNNLSPLARHCLYLTAAFEAEKI